MSTELWPVTIECLGVKLLATFPIDHPEYGYRFPDGRGSPEVGSND